MVYSVGVFIVLDDWLKVGIFLQLVAHFIKNIYSQILFCHSWFYNNNSVDIVLVFSGFSSEDEAAKY